MCSKNIANPCKQANIVAATGFEPATLRVEI